jgi:alkanesulfonate monooxygenase SsuD/methylene tetrahydromethanopterin reductase-like flavin-dependent oxidoreductase (luciferase family)
MSTRQLKLGAFHVEHDERYRRAREFYDVVTGLWDSFADDAFVRDVESGIYFDPDKMHVLDHRGEHYQVRGPLHIARPIQGWPVIVQAGASEAGRQLAAETAEVVFGAQSNLADAQRFYIDVKGRMAKLGRNPEHLKILPGAFVVVGETVDEAREKRENDLAKRKNLTVRQLAHRLGGFSGLSFVGTPRTIADQMEQWLVSEASDGFNVMFPYLPEGLEDFVEKVIPELQRRGIFRREYEGATLRENLGLPRPKNRFF